MASRSFRSKPRRILVKRFVTYIGFALWPVAARYRGGANRRTVHVLKKTVVFQVAAYHESLMRRGLKSAEKSARL